MTLQVRSFVLMLAACAVVAAGCGGNDSSGSASAAGGTAWAGSAKHAKAIEALYDEAVEAGHSQVVIYGPYAEYFQPIWDDFTKRFPEVQIVGKVLPAGGTAATVKAEVSSGQHVGDIVMQGLEGLTPLAFEDLLHPYLPPTAAKMSDEYKDEPKHRYVIVYGNVYGILYNKDKLADDEVPKTLGDLTDPKYAGMPIDDPSSGVLSAFNLLPIYQRGDLTLDFMRQLKANVTIVPATMPYYAKVGTGETPMVPFGSYLQYLRLTEAGANVGFVANPGMSTIILAATGIVKDAPHLAAAKLFQAWFLTPEAQQGLVEKAHAYGLAPDTKYPNEWPDYRKLYETNPMVKANDFHRVLGEFVNWVKPAFG